MHIAQPGWGRRAEVVPAAAWSGGGVVLEGLETLAFAPHLTQPPPERLNGCTLLPPTAASAINQRFEKTKKEAESKKRTGG